MIFSYFKILTHPRDLFSEMCFGSDATLPFFNTARLKGPIQPRPVVCIGGFSFKLQVCCRFYSKIPNNHDFLSWSKCHIFLRSPLVRDHFGTFFGSLLSSVAELRQKIKMADFPFFPIFETKNCSGAKLRRAEKKVSKPKILPRKCRICCQQKV